jgi:hypothetical protein
MYIYKNLRGLDRIRNGNRHVRKKKKAQRIQESRCTVMYSPTTPRWGAKHSLGGPTRANKEALRCSANLGVNGYFLYVFDSSHISPTKNTLGILTKVTPEKRNT